MYSEVMSLPQISSNEKDVKLQLQLTLPIMSQNNLILFRSGLVA